MKTITTSLSEGIHRELQSAAQELNIPKNKIIEKALDLYLKNIKKAQYIASYKRANSDSEIINLAEEGLELDQEILSILQL